MAPSDPGKSPSERDAPKKTTQHELPMVQSRETGDLIPGTAEAPGFRRLNEKPNPFAKSWAHFFAGG
jgi:solute carrier family 25 protein 33/36